MKKNISVAALIIIGVFLGLCFTANVSAQGTVIRYLRDLFDVAKWSTPSNGDVLYYNSAMGRWTNVASSSLPSGAITNENLTNWNKYPTNVWNDRQGGTALLTNLNGTGAATNLSTITNFTVQGYVNYSLFTNQETFNATNIVLSATNSKQVVIITNANPILLAHVTNITGYTEITLYLYSGGSARTVYLNPSWRGYDTNANPFVIPANKAWPVAISVLDSLATQTNGFVAVAPQLRP